MRLIVKTHLIIVLNVTKYYGIPLRVGVGDLECL